MKLLLRVPTVLMVEKPLAAKPFIVPDTRTRSMDRQPEDLRAGEYKALIRSAIRIAIVFLSTLAPVGLISCGGSGPSAPTRPSTDGSLTPGVYQLTLSSFGAIDSCSGGNRPEIGQVGSIILELLLRAEGREWIGRPQTPGMGDFELRLQPRGDELVAAVTMHGHGEHYFNGVVNQGTVDVSHSAAAEVRLILGPPLRVVGRASGEFAYDRPIFGRVTCTSATWLLERTGQL